MRERYGREGLFPLIHLASMADFDYFNGSGLIIDRIDDTVIALAESVAFLSGELFVAVRARAMGQSAYPVSDAA